MAIRVGPLPTTVAGPPGGPPIAVEPASHILEPEPSAVAPQPEPAPALELRPGIVMLCRPLREFASHVNHCQLPSWKLVARCVLVVVLALFRWHFCDRIVLVRREADYHSFNDEVEEIPRNSFSRRELFQLRYPHIASAAEWLIPVNERPNDALPAYMHPTRVHNGSGRVTVPNFNAYPEISAQTIRDYFLQMYRIQITDREVGNTITDLVFSRHLREATRNQISQIMG